jgi:hypothetical protein
MRRTRFLFLVAAVLLALTTGFAKLTNTWSGLSTAPTSAVRPAVTTTALLPTQTVVLATPRPRPTVTPLPTPRAVAEPVRPAETTKVDPAVEMRVTAEPGLNVRTCGSLKCAIVASFAHDTVLKVKNVAEWAEIVEPPSQAGRFVYAVYLAAK